MIDFGVFGNVIVTEEWLRWRQHLLNCFVYPVLQIIPAIG